MTTFPKHSLSYDPLHGYISFTSPQSVPHGETSERALVDHPWIQRLRQIHQLQTAWWVFPAAEHSRFQHVLGAMHLASRMVDHLYPSLAATCSGVPSRGYVESLMRMAALLHDVGHGPFGHFFDSYFLADFGLTHETLGAEIIRRDFADLLHGLRRNPHTALESDETIDPEHVAQLIVRPGSNLDGAQPLPPWLVKLQSLFCGLYTVDNTDFVLRDAYMSGFSGRSFDLDRLLYYTQFTEHGLTLHERGLPTLVRFLSVRAELFRSVYFHRTVRAIDLTLKDLFARSKECLFPGSPLDHLDDYRMLTDWSLLVRAAQWLRSEDPALRELGEAWQQIVHRNVPWKLMGERTVLQQPGEAEQASIFSSETLFEAALREVLPSQWQAADLRVDVAKHIYRPGAPHPAQGYNFLFDPATDQVRSLDQRELFRQLPRAFRICRVYARDTEARPVIVAALDRLTSRTSSGDDLTNM